MNSFRAIELCAGAGGQALGLEMAGFDHAAVVEIDVDCCNTLRLNRPKWDVREQDLREFSGAEFSNIDLLAGGLPCPPFSIAGKQLGEADERNMFPEGIRLIGELKPRAVMFENVRGILSAGFQEYREQIVRDIEAFGYRVDWRILNACDFGVPQLRPRVIMLAIRNDVSPRIPWPVPSLHDPPTVGDCLEKSMASAGWKGAAKWAAGAQAVAPTIVGGSKKHGGPDLGPTRAKAGWLELGVSGKSIANEPPEEDFEGIPRLTVRMVAKIQGFPDDWNFSGKKTAAYRQVGNAFPPPVAAAVASEIFNLLAEVDQVARDAA